MTVGALLLEVRDNLRTLFKSHQYLNEHNIRLGLDGRPATATSGGMFISIHLRDWTNPESQLTQILKDEVGIICTITTRTRKNPEDRDPDAVLVNATTSLTNVANDIQASLHGNGTLVASAGRIEPLRWVACIGPTEQYKDWFRSNDPYDSEQPVGYSMDVVFTGGANIRGIAC